MGWAVFPAVFPAVWRRTDERLTAVLVIALQSLSRFGVPLSTVIVTPWMRRPDGALDSDAISVAAGLEYDVGVGFTAVAGAWGSATKIRFRLTSSANYADQGDDLGVVALIATVSLVEYTISVTTLAEPAAGNDVAFGADTDVWFGADGDVVFGGT